MNIYRKISVISWILALVFSAGIFLPEFIGIDGFDGGFALSVISGFIAMVFAVTGWVCGRYAAGYDAVAKGEDILVRWTYTDEEWDSYTKTDYQMHKSDVKGLFYIVAGFAVFFGVVFPIFDHKNGLIVTYTMAGLIVFTGLIAYLSVRYRHNSNLRHKGETIISAKGVVINGQFHSWSVMGARMEGITIIADTFPPIIEIEYSTPSRYGRTQTFVRIPIPRGQEIKSREVVDALLAANEK